jgi:hypothetical protein
MGPNQGGLSDDLQGTSNGSVGSAVSLRTAITVMEIRSREKLVGVVR